MRTFVIRSIRTKRLIEAYEGIDGAVTAACRVICHNNLYPNDTWMVCEEDLDD